MDIGHLSYAEQKALHSEFLSVNAGALRSGFWFWKAEHFWKFVELVPMEDIPRILASVQDSRELNSTELFLYRMLEARLSGELQC